MKTLYLDCFSGVSGDMMLGLLVDLGVDLGDIEEKLAKLPVEAYSLKPSRQQRTSIEGTRIDVVCQEQHHHRSWADIDRMLSQSPLVPEVSDLARRIFRRIGEAEAKIHGVALESVHFHEVGAIDSIVDIVGASAGLYLLGSPRVICSPLPMSRGMVKTAHGAFPLPAPATLEILRGCPVKDAASDRELVTPTGAAIIAEIARFAPLPDMTPERIGYGVGGWDLKDRPNLLRGILGHEAQSGQLESDQVTVLETHLDDSNPEWLGALGERLLAAGALDAAFGPLQMKKNRPGTRLTVVAPVDLGPALARLVLRESSAIGVRSYETSRFKLRRKQARINTALGEAEIKLLYEGEQLLRISPEHGSCLQLDRPPPARGLPHCRKGRGSSV